MIVDVIAAETLDGVICTLTGAEVAQLTNPPYADGAYILRHDSVWNTAADDIVEYYIDRHYDHVLSWIADKKAKA